MSDKYIAKHLVVDAIVDELEPTFDPSSVNVLLDIATALKLTAEVETELARRREAQALTAPPG